MIKRKERKRSLRVPMCGSTSPCTLRSMDWKRNGSKMTGKINTALLSLPKTTTGSFVRHGVL